MAPAQTATAVTAAPTLSLQMVNHAAGAVSLPHSGTAADSGDLMPFTPAPGQPAVAVVPSTVAALPAALPLAMAVPAAGPCASWLVTSPLVLQPVVGFSKLDPLASMPPPVTHWAPSPFLGGDLDSDDNQWPVPWRGHATVVDHRHWQAELASAHNL